jgi:protein phosphatase
LDASPSPPVTAVRVRARGAVDEGSAGHHRGHHSYGVYDDATAAFAVLARGLAFDARAAHLAVETCERVFRGRQTAILDTLAEIWWRGEHQADAPPADAPRAVRLAGRPPPYAALPIADRAAVRDRVRLLLERRIADSMGDAAVLRAEQDTIFALPERALERVHAEVMRRSETKPDWSRAGVSAAAVVFTGGHASIAHVGDCGVARVRAGSLEPLTQPHDLVSVARHAGTATPDDLARLPAGVIVRVIGMPTYFEVDARRVAVETGDVFVLGGPGFWSATPPDEIARAIAERGTAAAAYLVARGARAHPPPRESNQDLTVLLVEIV